MNGVSLFSAQALEAITARNARRITVSKSFPLVGLLLTAGILAPNTAQALPSFAIQTDQPCSACHVGSFGPQLKPFGRDFKLYGYTPVDDEKKYAQSTHVPVALYLRQSFTNTKKNQPAGQNPEALYGNSNNDNFALDELSGWIAGRVNSTTGVYIEGSYDGVGGQLHLDNAEARHIHEGSIFGTDYVAGITVSDAPTVTDLWNSTPTWGFPFNSTKIAAGPAASTLIDGGLSQTVVGAGAYVMWNDWVYAEFNGYKGLSHNGLNMVGTTPATGQDQYDGLIPYWRLALQHELVKNHYFELGTYGLDAKVYPQDDHTSAFKDHITDVAFDANYQWLGGGNDHFVSAHSTYIHENRDLKASNFLTNSTNLRDTLNTFRAEVSYSYQDTYTPTVQYFHTWGSADANLWSTGANGSPNSDGFLFELALVPFDKPGSPTSSWVAYNTRLELQYTAYTKFDGTRSGASGHNTIFLDLGIIFAPKW